MRFDLGGSTRQRCPDAEHVSNVVAPVLLGSPSYSRTGDTLTLADFAIGVCFGYQVPLELPVDDLENLARWWNALSATESGKVLLPG